MMTPAWRTLAARARRDFRGYPIATVAFYGPDDRVATKTAVAIIPHEDAEVRDLERWHAHAGDVRDDEAIGAAALAFVKAHGARTLAMVDQIIGCPHEEGIDYPLGAPCPRCPFWADRDRWAGLPVDDTSSEDEDARRPAPDTRLTFVTDLRHYLDEDGNLPDLHPRALSLALHQGAIVEWMTMSLPGGQTEVTNVYCRRRPRRRRCRGQIHARFHPVTDAIIWRCPHCGDNGIIDGWAGTRWDRGPTLLPEDDELLN